jgi:hypothetical protein
MERRECERLGQGFGGNGLEVQMGRFYFLDLGFDLGAPGADDCENEREKE